MKAGVCATTELAKVQGLLAPALTDLQALQA